mgnify:CR=1 FL=1
MFHYHLVYVYSQFTPSFIHSLDATAVVVVVVVVDDDESTPFTQFPLSLS